MSARPLRIASRLSLRQRDSLSGPRFARARFAPARIALARVAPRRSVALRSAEERAAPLRFAPLRFAPLRGAPLRSALMLLCWSRHAFHASTPCCRIWRCSGFAIARVSLSTRSSRTPGPADQARVSPGRPCAEWVYHHGHSRRPFDDSSRARARPRQAYSASARARHETRRRSS